MKALLLAAGLGTRLRPLTNSVPKCLVPLHGRPLLDIWLDMLVSAGVGPLLVNMNYLADQVRTFLELHLYCEQVHAVFEENLLGTAGTLLKNRDFFGNEPLILVHADNLSRFNVQAFIKRHEERPNGCEITMMTFATDSPSSCGIVELDAHGVVTGFHEKVTNPPGNLANGAVYIIEPSLFEMLTSLGTEFIDFSTEVLPHYVGRIFTFHNNCYHRDIGTMASYESAIREYEQWRE